MTYSLEGKGERQLLQHRSDGENQPLLTCWKVKDKGDSFSTDEMGKIRHHLLAGR